VNIEELVQDTVNPSVEIAGMGAAVTAAVAVPMGVTEVRV
jgi:hypothetical protein